jgi:DNA-binding Lrp family transcriptional regulator
VRPLFVKIKCELGATYTVAGKIYDEVEGISEIYSTSGEYDLLAKFHVPEGIPTGRFINDQLHKIPGIRDTYTIVAFRIYEHPDVEDPLVK